MKKGSPKTIYLKDYTPPPYLIDNVTLRFELGEESTDVLSTLSIRRNPGVASSGDTLRLDGNELELISVRLNGTLLSPDQYQVDTESLILLQVPSRCKVEIATRIKPQQNTSLEGLYKSSGNFCTQCEAEGFRKITYFLDRPDVMAKYTTTIVADKTSYPILLSNGNLIDSGVLENARHFATWQDPFPKPSYLFAMVAGQLVCKEDAFETRSGRKIMLRIYVQSHNIDKCDHAMTALKKAMKWDEDTYGLEYDLDVYMIVAVDDFNMGAMENKGLNIFNSKYVLARADTATDDDYDAIEGVIAHEYFHNWTGNRVTCRDWFQLSLKEGLTVFRDQEFSADLGSRAVKRIQDVRQLRTHQFPEDSGPMAHPVRPQSYIEINNFYTVTVYEKGAELVRMYQTLLGKKGFRNGMELYFQRHDGQAVTTEDFAAAMADANQYDLSQFRLWYDQAGTPEVTVAGEWDPNDSSYTLQVSQFCPTTANQTHKKPFHIPLKLGLLSSDGNDIPLQLEDEHEASGTLRVLNIRQSEHRFRFKNVSERPVPSLLRDFSAPVKLRYDYTEQELAFLLANDRDAYSRWEAGQKLVIKNIKALMHQYKNNLPLVLDDYIIPAFEQLLENDKLDKALVTELLTLPSESYLSEVVNEIDVDAIHFAREYMRRSMATALEHILLQTYDDNEQPEGYRYDPVAAGSRRLKNLCLGYLTALDKPDHFALAKNQFDGADNMTDAMGALRALIDSDCKQRRQALSSFYDRWRHDTLVMDKWFTIQAISSRKDTLDRVKQLMKHTSFSMRNPNKVRALVGAFAHGNPVNFHQADGAGYSFVADRVLELDKLNPQVAARLVRVFSRWKKYDAARQAFMQEQLKRISSEQEISKDVYEIVSKSLE